MILGFTLFTWFHTILSLVAIVAGFVVVRDLLASRTPPTWTAVYIATAVLTSVTGFGFTAPLRRQPTWSASSRWCSWPA